MQHSSVVFLSSRNNDRTGRPGAGAGGRIVHPSLSRRTQFRGLVEGSVKDVFKTPGDRWRSELRKAGGEHATRQVGVPERQLSLLRQNSGTVPSQKRRAPVRRSHSHPQRNTLAAVHMLAAPSRSRSMYSVAYGKGRLSQQNLEYNISTNEESRGCLVAKRNRKLLLENMMQTAPSSSRSRGFSRFLSTRYADKIQKYYMKKRLRTFLYVMTAKGKLYIQQDGAKFNRGSFYVDHPHFLGPDTPIACAGRLAVDGHSRIQYIDNFSVSFKHEVGYLWQVLHSLNRRGAHLFDIKISLVYGRQSQTGINAGEFYCAINPFENAGWFCDAYCAKNVSKLRLRSRTKQRKSERCVARIRR